MSKYRSYGGFDDSLLTDGDGGFVGMNQRLQPNQLQAGEVVLSKNGRIEGYWQPRRGVVLRSGALSSSAAPLQLPFWLVDTAGGKDITAAELDDDVVELTVTGHGLDADYQTMTVTGTLTSDGTTPVVFPVLPYVGIFRGKPGFSLDHDNSVSSVTFEESNKWVLSFKEGTAEWTSTANVASPELVPAGAWDAVTNPDAWKPVSPATGTPVATGSNGIPAWTKVKGLGFSTTDPNGIHLVSVKDADTLTYPLVGANETFTIAGGDDKVLTELTDNAVTEILGSCIYSDPTSDNDESIIMATGLSAKRVDLTDYTVIDLPYPGATIVSDEVNMLHAFDRVYLFRSGGNQSWEWIPGGKIITAATLASNIVTVTVKAHGLETGDVVTISGLTFTGTDPNGDRTITFATADTFTFALTSANETYGVTAAKMVAKGFTKVIGGVYTQPQAFTIQSSAVSISDGLLTATVTGNTTIKVGDFVFIHYTAIPSIKHLEGNSYQVVSASSTSIQFYVPAGNLSAGGSNTFEFGGRFSVGGGFIHTPAPPWASYFQRRLWVPYWYTVGGTTASPTYTDRKERDEILASDILDGDTYDQIYSQFKVTAGIADFLVGFHSFTEDNLVVFNRNSIHIVNKTQGSLEDTIVTELTREVGCLARKSIVGFANLIFFLSDSGVYAVEFQNDYNLRGTGEPLSKAIQPFIDRINKRLADKSVGMYYDNRYYIAVPIDSEAGADDATGNNTILIYNMLNKAWESVDTFGGGQFNIVDIHYGKVGARNSLFYVNDQGGIHEANANETPVDVVSLNPVGSSATYNVDYELKSRGFMLGTYDRKKFSAIQVQCQGSDENTDAVFSFSTEDPDAELYEVGRINNLIGQDLPPNESANLRMRLGNPRGLYAQLTISANTSGSQPIGRPKVNSIAIDATITNRQTISQF
jgi:hypothetical protein